MAHRGRRGAVGTGPSILRKSAPKRLRPLPCRGIHQSIDARRTLLSSLLPLLLLSGPVAAATPVLSLTAAEQAQLVEDQVVLRTLPASAGRVKALGVAEVHAGLDATWRALLDWNARLGGNSAVRAVIPYQPATATEQWVRWEISRFGFDVVYHNHYRVDRAGGVLIHELDPAKENDLSWSRGTYELGPSPVNPAWTRLAYTVESDFGRAVPGFIADWLCGSGVRNFLEDLVKRAEGSPS